MYSNIQKRKNNPASHPCLVKVTPPKKCAGVDADVHVLHIVAWNIHAKAERFFSYSIGMCIVQYATCIKVYLFWTIPRIAPQSGWFLSYTHLHIRTDRFRLAMNYILLRITIASLSLYVVSTLAYALCVRCFCQRILSYWLRTIGKYRIGNVYLNYIFFARAERCIWAFCLFAAKLTWCVYQHTSMYYTVYTHIIYTRATPPKWSTRRRII